MVGGHQKRIPCVEGACMIVSYHPLHNHKHATHSSQAVSVTVIAWV